MTLFGMRKFLDSLAKKAKKLPDEVVSKLENVVLQRQSDDIFRGLGKVGGAPAVFPDGTNPGIVGQRWQPFSEATFKINPKRKGGKLLQDTGHLRMSVKAHKKSPGVIQWGTFVPYGKKHQFGAKKKLGKRTVKIPARPFVFLTEPYVNKTVKFIEKKVEGMQE